MRKDHRTQRLRKIGFTSELQDAMHQQFRAFRKKFGRDPGPDDPVFFDPDSATPAPMPPQTLQRELLEVMTKARISPEFIYAYRRTGLIVLKRITGSYRRKTGLPGISPFKNFYKNAPVTRAAVMTSHNGSFSRPMEQDNSNDPNWEAEVQLGTAADSRRPTRHSRHPKAIKTRC